MKRGKKPTQEADSPASDEPVEDMQEAVPNLDEPSEARIATRAETKLQSIVQVKEGEESHREKVEVSSVSKHGASFDISRPCIVGRLITLVLPMPRSLRAYDLNEAHYPVVGLVQHCEEQVIDGVTSYHVGVALVGKTIPQSYKQDPMQNYRIVGMAENGLWQIMERDGQHIQRRYPRFPAQLDVVIIALRMSRNDGYKETTVTQDIGVGGASVFCSLDVAEGDTVKFVCNKYDFFAKALIKGRNVSGDPNVRPTLHLEFVDARFPIEKAPGDLGIAVTTGPWPPSDLADAEGVAIDAADTSIEDNFREIEFGST